MEHPNERQPWRRLPTRFAKELKTTFASLNSRNFRVYSLGQVISLSGTWMQTIALSWLVYRLTGSATALGMVSFAGSMPILLFTYFGGMIADRYDRKRILAITQFLAMIEAATLTALTFTGLISVPWLVALACVRGTITAIELPARQSFIPDLVPKDQLHNAIGINSAIWNTSRTLGPALAGILIGVFGETICFGFNTVSYVAAFISLYLIKLEPRGKETEAEAKLAARDAGRSVWSILMGPELKYILLLSAATSIFGFQYGTLLPVVADKVLGGSSSTLGFLSAAAGLGALFGSLTLANRGHSAFLRRALGLACLVLACAIVLIGFSTVTLVSFFAVALAGGMLSFQLSGGNSIVQTSVSPSMRGRVMGVYSTFMLGFAPVAAMMAGWMAETFGVSNALYVSAAAVFVSALTYLHFTRKTSGSVDENRS
jgi:MFS family permease